MVFYTGSYTIREGSPASNPTGKGIGRFEFDPNKGEFRQLGYTWQRSPSYLFISKDKKHLYAAEECKGNFSPKIFSYEIGSIGELSLLNFQKIDGAYACHLCEANKQMIVANYMTGNALVFPIENDGSLATANQVIQHTGSGIHPERQTESHIHMVYPLNEQSIFLVDLGQDKALAYSADELGTWNAVTKNNIFLHPGAGARHMVTNSDNSFAYILGELTGEIEVFENTGNGFRSIQRILFIPENYDGHISGAAIRLHPNGKFLYASERESDTISVFKVNTTSGKLSYSQYEGTRGRTPRDFNIDATGEWLFAANQDSNLVVAFKIKKDGALQYASKQVVDTPVCIALL